MQVFQGKVGEFSECIWFIQVKVMECIGQEVQLLVVFSYKSYCCGLFLNCDVVFGGNVSNDFIVDVVKGLDVKIIIILFNFELLFSGNGVNGQGK